MPESLSNAPDLEGTGLCALGTPGGLVHWPLIPRCDGGYSRSEKDEMLSCVRHEVEGERESVPPNALAASCLSFSLHVSITPPLLYS